jgi:hypothetical protein
MAISIFLSHPRPSTDAQRQFVDTVRMHLHEHGFAPRTLGVTDYDLNAPLRAVRRLLVESHGVLAIAFRRMLVVEGRVLRAGPHGGKEDLETVGGAWLTSPWTHIEIAIGHELGLPVLHVREQGVRADGLLERGMVGLCGPQLDLDAVDPARYVRSDEWVNAAGTWEGHVRTVFERRGSPAQLFSY